MKQEGFKQFDLEGFIPVLMALRAAKRPLLAAPTRIPKNLLEQFELYDSGGTQRLYVWFGKDTGWHYFTAT